MLEEALRQLAAEFALSQREIKTIAVQFQEQMVKGLNGEESSLRMLPSYLQVPDGRERGSFLALDFGGSNVRAAVVALNGEGILEETGKVSRSLRDSGAGWDYSAADVGGEALFDFLAGVVEETLTGQKVLGPLPLGFTFSFLYRQSTLKEGILLKWNKEMKVSGVEGRDVGQLLSAALGRRGLDKYVKLSAIINDSVASFLTAAYQDSAVNIASILGTGYNTCYLEPQPPGCAAAMVINTEAGNFAAVPGTGYDHKVDRESENPGEQQMEKRISGKYLGELFRQIVLDFSQRGLLGDLPRDSAGLGRWKAPFSVTGKDMASICLGSKAYLSFCPQRLGFALQEIAQLLVTRSARLAAAGLLGVVRHLDPDLKDWHKVAIDGSLYKEMPGYADACTAALAEVLGNRCGQIAIQLSAGGSLTGAGIAAALAEKVGGKEI